ncbi:MAG: HEPN domain-containing protein [Paludibacteraceae bacterium]|nr:HEPN domain-containing protein [Paludibacteraceae bacterium]MBQ6763779.1 HEPN domain-containing protein [Paludibacteraceae bacterium]MBQ9339747.1 HEPN domain-containing protein [Paludibacteraceae bacterium]
MSLNDEERQILVNLEKEKALNTFAEMDVLKQAGLWNNIANRLYYSAFHAVSALLINDHYNIGSHQGAVIMLHQHYVKTGLLSKEDGAFYSQLQTMREKSDYNCTYNATESDTAPRIEQTKLFIDKIFGLIK